MLVRFVRPLAGFALRAPAVLVIRGYAKASPIVEAINAARTSVVKNAAVKKPAKKVASKKTIAKKKPVKKPKKTVKKAIKKPKKTVKKAIKKPKKRIVQKLVAKRDVPRFPGNLFSQFVKENHSAVAGIPPHDRIRELSSQWQGLSESEKNHWQSRAMTAQESYQRAYEQYVTSLTPDEIAKENALRRKLKKNGRKSNIKPLVDSRRPKRPLTAYLLFNIENRDPSLSVAENGKRSGETWRNMSDSEKTKYFQLAKARSEKYRQDMEAYMNIA
ncbi:High mobility group protein B3 [Neolecta irregularis DAH-3]|uniref:High mobility group protein B3 n=1 Tax=Neolecta irregularis (strain DAH-3) TaxID=1198029 RepID=A0A1U7LK47_NEOID|nr:High mobility group protein B3 [Neolecta irregularis DAH-3]|eukprot:OLL23027.1 High mobility group protein B3 [Neolecta irregularis DAH-3]